MKLDGVFNCETKTPIGVQASTLTFDVSEDGRHFTGTSESNTGTLEFLDGQIEGNRMSWRMKVTNPIKIELTCDGELVGDDLSVTINAGWAGKMQLRGTRTITVRR